MCRASGSQLARQHRGGLDGKRLCAAGRSTGRSPSQVRGCLLAFPGETFFTKLASCLLSARDACFFQERSRIRTTPGKFPSSAWQTLKSLARARTCLPKCEARGGSRLQNEAKQQSLLS
jgi:hypothetical protein